MNDADTTTAAQQADAVSVTREGPVAVVTLSSADGRNALGREMLVRIGPAIREADAMPATRVILVRSAGRHFSVGGDLRVFAREGARSSELLREIGPSLNEASRTLHESAKVTVCAVRGAVGGGAIGFMGACDVVFASTSATFALGYSLIGTSPDAGVSYFLTRDIGYRRALELYLTSERFDAGRALELGIVNRVVDDADLDDASHAFAQQVARGPFAALTRGKCLFRAAAQAQLATHLEAEIASFAENAAHPDFTEGVRAFLEQRAPSFTG